MWEPFTASARHAIVRAQQVAQLFGSPHIGVQHIAFALAEGDDAVGAVMATAIDRAAIRAQLGAAESVPTVEMAFTSGSKRVVELAFENARRLNHDYIGAAHIALAVLGSDECPALVAGTHRDALRAALVAVTEPHPSGEG